MVLDPLVHSGPGGEARGVLEQISQVGTRDGGAFESPLIRVSVLDERGKAMRTEFCDPHHLDRALARFEGLCAQQTDGAADPA